MKKILTVLAVILVILVLLFLGFIFTQDPLDYALEGDNSAFIAKAIDNKKVVKFIKRNARHKEERRRLLREESLWIEILQDIASKESLEKYKEIRKAELCWRRKNTKEMLHGNLKSEKELHQGNDIIEAYDKKTYRNEERYFLSELFFEIHKEAIYNLNRPDCNLGY